MKNNFVRIIIFIILSGLFCFTFLQLSGIEYPREINDYYLQHGVEDTGAVNLITAILFDYRGFDTLGEATVILAAAASLSFLVPKKRAPMLYSRFTIIVYQIVTFMLPILILLGSYLILFGHLSPGGGFTGGVVLATVPILLTITYGVSFGEKKFPPAHKSLLESSGALSFILFGILGIITGSAFLASGQSIFPLGQPGNFLSAGLIPYLNLAVGLKVGAGLAIIFNSLIKED